MSNENEKDNVARLALIGLLILGIGYAVHVHMITETVNAHIEKTNQHITDLAKAVKNQQ